MRTERFPRCRRPEERRLSLQRQVVAEGHGGGSGLLSSRLLGGEESGLKSSFALSLHTVSPFGHSRYTHTYIYIADNYDPVIIF